MEKVTEMLRTSVLSTLTLWVPITIRRGVLDTALCDEVCQWLATGRWFSSGTPFSSSDKTDSHDIIEILLKSALNTINQTKLSRIYSRKSWNGCAYIVYIYIVLNIFLKGLKAYRLSELNFFVYIKSCQYSMFYTNKRFWTRIQV